jgi:soluble lytic murein transglycosylase-like protein
MNGSWKAWLATLLTLVAAAAALLPAGAAAAPARPMNDEVGDTAPASARYIVRLERDEVAIQTAKAQADTLATPKPPPDNALGQLVFKLEQDNAAYRYREAIRRQQVDLLEVASQTPIADVVIRDAPPDLAVVLADTIGAWRSIWHLAGIDEFNLVRIHARPLGAADPSATLAEYYRASAGHYQLDWTFLASINFIESDFGRVNGPSTAGALGPMQFMPATWTAYGGGGDVNNPKDAIDAAARYLFLSGGRQRMDSAIFAYNHDNDYVAAVNFYADVIRHDAGWLDRLYYWNTFG